MSETYCSDCYTTNLSYMGKSDGLCSSCKGTGEASISGALLGEDVCTDCNGSGTCQTCYGTGLTEE